MWSLAQLWIPLHSLAKKCLKTFSIIDKHLRFFPNTLRYSRNIIYFSTIYFSRPIQQEDWITVHFYPQPPKCRQIFCENCYINRANTGQITIILKQFVRLTENSQNYFFLRSVCLTVSFREVEHQRVTVIVLRLSIIRFLSG